MSSFPPIDGPLGSGLDHLPPPSSVLVIFGASGNLARRKLLPAIYNLAFRAACPSGSG